MISELLHSKINGWFDLLKEDDSSRNMKELESYLKRDVVNYDAKFKRLVEILSADYER